MRKRVLHVLTAILFLSLCVPLQGICGMRSGNFQYYAGLEGDIRKNTIHEVVLSNDILSGCSPECSNLRLLGPDGLEIPYAILKKDRSGTHSETNDLQVVRYEQSGNSSTVIVKSPPKNKLFSAVKLDTPDHDFQRKVRLQGGNDMKNWTLLAEDSIYDFTSQVDLRKTDIVFGPSRYLYFRIDMTSGRLPRDSGEKINLRYKDLLFSVDGQAGNRLRINRIQGQTPPARETEAVYDEAEFTQLENYQEKEGETVFFLKSGLPAGEFHFNVSDPYFYRMVEIYGSDSGEKRSYRCVARGPIYRFLVSGDKETKVHIASLPDKYRHYKFVIRNGDSPPLKLDSVKLRWVRRSLYFVALHDHQKYTLAVGDASLKKPDYDVSRFIHQGNWRLQPSEILRISRIRENPDYNPLSTVRVKELFEKRALTIIVIMLTIGISYWLYQLLRKSSRSKA